VIGRCLDRPGQPVMASFRACRSLHDSSLSSLHHPLLLTSPDDGDGSECSDGVDEGKLDSPLPSKSSFRSSQGPITESFTLSNSCSAHPRRAIPNFCRRLPTFFSRVFKPRWSCSSNNGSHGSILGFEAPFSQRPKPVRRLIYVCLGILIMLFVLFTLWPGLQKLIMIQWCCPTHCSRLWSHRCLLPRRYPLDHRALGPGWATGRRVGSLAYRLHT
jgi:hypothetical protein